MKRFVACAIQMDVKAGDINFNLKTAINVTERALKYNPNFLIFPEMFATGFDYPYIKGLAKEYFNELASFLLNLSFKTGSFIVGGSIPEIY